MAEEPDTVVLRLLGEIRATQQNHGDVLKTHGEMLTAHGGSLSRLEKRVEDLYKISTHTLGVAVTAHERIESIESRLDTLSGRVERLEAKQ
jgi:hypothetical protein